MKQASSRLVPVTAALVLALAACGSDSPSTDGPVDPPDSVVDGLRAPTPIQASGGGSVGGDTRTAAAENATSDMMIAPAFVVSEYVVGPDLPALPDNSTGYVFDGSVDATAEQVAEIAQALGVSGEPVRVDDGFSISWRVGPDDGSAPSLTLYDDAMLGWNYSSAWANRPVVGCAAAGAEPAIEPIEVDPETVDPAPDAEPTETLVPETITPDSLPAEPADVECVEPEPPANVPSAEQAEARARDILGALGVGVDSDPLTFETYADEWSASATANETVDGIVTRSWGFSFGGEGALDYAWGSAAVPEPVGPYPLVDLDTAIERLNSGSYGFGYGGRDIALMDDVATAVAPEPEIAVAEAPPEEDLPVDIREGDPTIDELPEPEMITVTLVDVQPDLWWVWDVEGSAWLVPAYRFIGDDGGWYTVPAVTDDYLVQVDDTADPGDGQVDPGEPIPVEPDDGIGDGGDTPPAPGVEPMPGGELLPMSPEMYAAGAPLVAQYLGAPLDVFEAEVMTDGYGPVRVVAEDGVGLAVTADLQVGRVDVAVVTVDGVQYVVDAAVENDPTTGATDPEATVVGVFDGVEFYPACGNESLTHEGVRWFQVNASDFPEQYARAVDGYRENMPEPGAVSGFARVVAPGPGDDTGRLVVWSDGVARWVSDSGDLDVWLVDEELTYRWEC